jgi:hypothetical protein
MPLLGVGIIRGHYDLGTTWLMIFQYEIGARRSRNAKLCVVAEQHTRRSMPFTMRRLRARHTLGFFRDGFGPRNFLRRHVLGHPSVTCNRSCYAARMNYGNPDF